MAGYRGALCAAAAWRRQRHWYAPAPHRLLNACHVVAAHTAGE